MATGQPFWTNWEIHPLMSAKMRTSLISWIVSTETDPRVGGASPWNLFLVLHQLTKPPFEPLTEASLKHLTFKTIFLLALGSGKSRSEIHAWQSKNIRHQLTSPRCLFTPYPAFFAITSWPKEGPDSVSPVVILALVPTLDKSFKGNRFLCPVKTLRYYFDRTSDLSQKQELDIVSFKKGFNKNISPCY